MLKSVSDSEESTNLKHLYNEIGEFDYDQVKEIAGRIGSGELEITRLNPREEQGRNAGGQRNVKASVIAGASTRTSQKTSRRRRPTRKEKVANNQKAATALENYAKNEGIWFDYNALIEVR